MKNSDLAFIIALFFGVMALFGFILSKITSGNETAIVEKCLSEKTATETARVKDHICYLTSNGNTRVLDLHPSITKK